MMIVEMDKMSAPSSRERAQRLLDNVTFFCSLFDSLGTHVVIAVITKLGFACRKLLFA